ncbi:MAG: hypothetical protein ACI90E_001857, partial [Yoonia sp.]
SQIRFLGKKLFCVAEKKMPGTRPGKSNREVKGTSVEASSPSQFQIGAAYPPFKKIMLALLNGRYA